MSVNGLQQPYVNNSLDGLVYVEVDGLTINGIPVDPTTFIPYTGATKPVHLGPFSLETLTSLSARQVNFTTFTSTMMTGPTTSSLFTADAWRLSNSIQISSLTGGAFLSTSYLHIRDATNSSTLLTLQSDGIADFANARVRISTMASNVYDVVNLSTLQASIAFIEDVNALNYLPYTNALQNLDMGASTITTSGLVSAGAIRITSSVSNEDFSLSVNALNQLEICNIVTGNKIKTGGDSMDVPANINAGGFITCLDTQVFGTNYLHYGAPEEWRQTIPFASADFEIQDDAGVMRLRLSKTTGLTVSTLTVTQVPSATPSLSLGIDGGGSLVSYAVPTTSGLVPYVGAIANLQLGSNNLIANTARFTGVTSATPSLALGVDVSGNLNTFAVPSATNLLPLNNTWTGTNQFNNSVTVYNGLGVASGTFSKQTATAGSLVQITGGGASSSPYLEFLFGGNSRGYVGAVTATDFDIVGQNGAQLNLYTGGIKRLVIDTSGHLTMGIEKSLFLYNFGATNNAGLRCNSNGDIEIFAGTSGPITRLAISAIGTYIQGGQNTYIQSPTSVNAGGSIDASCSLTVQTNTHRLCQTFTLALAPSTWFPVVIRTDQAWNQNYPAKFTIGRSSVHTNGSWTGGMMFNMELHGSNWGNDCDYYKVTSTGNLYTSPATYKFFVGNVIIDPTSGYAVIYLRGGTTYFFTGEGCSLLFYPATSPFAGYTIPAGNNTTYYAITSPVAPWTRGYVQYDSITNLYSFGDFSNGNPNVAGGGTTGFLGNTDGQLSFYNQYQTNGFLTHAVASLNANILYSNTAVTQGNPGSWYGGWTLLTNTATPSVNQGALGLGSNYVDNSFITSLRPGVVWMNLGIWNAQTTFTYYGNPSGYTVPSGGSNVSDVREKHCISDVCTKNSLRKIMMVKTKYYKRKYYDTGIDSEGKERTPVPEHIKNEVCIGVMAQDLLETPLAPAVSVAPIKSEGACGDDDGTRYGVNYGDIGIHVIGAVQELKKQNDRQQMKLDDLERIVSDQNKLLEFLLAKIK